MATKTEESNDPKEFEEYFKEIKDIEKSTSAEEPDIHGSDDELSKPPDGTYYLSDLPQFRG